MTQKAEKYARHHGKKEDWNDILKRLPPAYHVTGFDEPELPVISAEHDGVVPMNWPFIPAAFAPRAQNGRPINTLNARDDKIFSKGSIYRDSAQSRRCAVPLDGFFDHHHKQGVAFPHYIRLKSDEPMFVAGLWQEFESDDLSQECVTLVTTRANKEMAWIHNEPAYSPESRMILILPNREIMETWIHGSAEEAQEIIGPLPDGALEYWACQPIKSNKKLNRVYAGNVAEIQNKLYYPQLEEEQGSLF